MMDFLTNLFLESTWKLGLFSFLLFAVVLLMRKRMQSEALRSRSLPATFLAIALLFLTQFLVETQRERILNQLDAFVRAIETPNAEALKTFIALDYQSEGLDREGFLQSLDSWLKKIDIHDTRYRRRDVTVTGDSADMTLGAMATVHRDGGTGETHTGRWHLKWTHESGEWRIREVRIEMIDTIPIDQMRPYLP